MKKSKLSSQKKRLKENGQILNHSTKVLLVIENDSGKPIAHLLGPKRKSPASVDADGFRRLDGKPILLHKGWWKVPDSFRADIFELGADFLMPVSVMVPVGDKHFGEYQISEDKNWGEKLTYVTAAIKNKRRKTVAYVVEHKKQISVPEAIRLTQSGRLDNSVVVKRGGKSFLRTKKNMRIDDNLTA